jgi:S-(hydroxymethyl)glutathione dehydrogenase/alcohol dehydrogenase
VIVTIGVVHGEHIAQAFAAIRKGGTAVVTGRADDRGRVPVAPFELTLMPKRLQGSLFGACSPSVDIPRQLELYRSGQLIHPRRGRQGYEDMAAGKNIRGVVVCD